MEEGELIEPGVHYYRVYGLGVRSDIPFYEMAPSSLEEIGRCGWPLVEVRLGVAPDALDGGRVFAPWLEASRGRGLFTIAHIGRFLVEGGERIIVERAPGALWADVRAYLIGWAFAALAHQRGLIPLHISAVISDRGLIAFTGPSGAGKSTIAAHMHLIHKLRYFCDDVAVLNPDGNDPTLLHAGVNVVKLWDDALTTLGMDRSGLRQDYSREKKFHALWPAPGAVEPRSLSILTMLEWGDAPAVHDVSGKAKVQAVVDAIHWFDFVALFSNRITVARCALRVAEKVGVKRLVRPRSAAHMSEAAALVLAD